MSIVAVGLGDEAVVEGDRSAEVAKLLLPSPFVFNDLMSHWVVGLLHAKLHGGGCIRWDLHNASNVLALKR